MGYDMIILLYSLKVLLEKELYTEAKELVEQILSAYKEES